MPYRFVKITNYYRSFLNEYYHRNSFIKEKSYNEQHQHLMSQLFGWSDFFVNHLSKVNVEAFEIVANASPLQNTWKNEFGVKSIGFDFLFDQIKYLQPTVLFFQDSLFCPTWLLKKIRAEISSVKLIVGWCCSPYTIKHETNFNEYDLMFVCSPGFYQDFKNKGFNVYQVYHGFEDSILSKLKINNQTKQNDFTFIGSLIPGDGFHEERAKLLKNIYNENIKLNANVSYQLDSPITYLQKSIGYMSAKLLNNIGLNNIVESITPLRKISQLQSFPKWLSFPIKMKNSFSPSIYGKEMFEMISKSKICFNNHGEVAGNFACNIRLFETTGMGSVLLTDHKNNMQDLFEIDNEVVTYKNNGECVDKVKWLLDNPTETEKIAKNGQAKTLKTHQLKDRILNIHEIISSHLKSK